MLVIGVVGKNGSGKDEVLKYLKKQYGVPYFSTGDMVREIAAEEGLEATRENLGMVSEKYFRQYGKGYFVQKLGQKIKNLHDCNAAGISGIRSPEDVAILENMFGNDFILLDVYVTDPRERFKRMVDRKQARDPLSYEQFLKQDDEEEKLFNVSGAEKKADVFIANDGSLEDLYLRIEYGIQQGSIPVK